MFCFCRFLFCVPPCFEFTFDIYHYYLFGLFVFVLLTVLFACVCLCSCLLHCVVCLFVVLELLLWFVFVFVCIVDCLVYMCVFDLFYFMSVLYVHILYGFNIISIMFCVFCFDYRICNRVLSVCVVFCWCIVLFVLYDCVCLLRLFWSVSFFLS